jgi:hypothetical protein
MEIISGGYTVRKIKAGTGGGVKGGIAVVSSSTAVKAAAAPTAATVLGLFLEDVDADAVAQIAVPDKDALIRAPYVGSSKTSLADTDLGAVFDLNSSDPTKVDLDDTTGGIAVCQGYDNDNDTIDFVIPEAAMYW